MSVTPQQPRLNQQLTLSASVKGLVVATQGTPTYTWYYTQGTELGLPTTGGSIRAKYLHPPYDAGVLVTLFATVTTTAGLAGASDVLSFTLGKAPKHKKKTPPSGTGNGNSNGGTKSGCSFYGTCGNSTSNLGNNNNLPSTTTTTPSTASPTTSSQTVFPGLPVSGALLASLSPVPAADFPVQTYTPPQFVQVAQPPVPPVTLPGSLPPLGAIIGGAIVALLVLLGAAVEQRSNRRPVRPASAG